MNITITNSAPNYATFTISDEATTYVVYEEFTKILLYSGYQKASIIRGLAAELENLQEEDECQSN